MRKFVLVSACVLVLSIISVRGDGLCDGPWPGYNDCSSQMQWLAQHWHDDPKYAQHGVNGTACSFQIYLNTEENFCPSPVWSLPNEVHENPDGTISFPVYRAATTNSPWATKLMNSNGADAAGVLSYLHSEVVPLDMDIDLPTCQRKFGIDAIMRFNATVKNPPGTDLQPFGPFLAFDSGKCTVPDCDALLQQKGYYVGRQSQSGNPRAKYGTAYWYSFPEQGLCDYPTGTKTCTYSAKYAGHFWLDELAGVHPNFYEFCRAQGIEFERKDRDLNACVTLRGVPFWRDPCDMTASYYRLQKFYDVYDFNDLPEPWFNDSSSSSSTGASSSSSSSSTGASSSSSSSTGHFSSSSSTGSDPSSSSGGHSSSSTGHGDTSGAGGLSKGAVAAIIIVSVLAGISAVAAAIYFLVYRPRRSQQQALDAPLLAP